MKHYKNMFLALFTTIQELSLPDSVKISKHWNNGMNKKHRGVYHCNHKEKSHVW